MHHLLSQHVVNADIAFFGQFDGEAASSGIRIECGGFLLRHFFHACDEAGTGEGDVIHPSAIFTCTAVSVLVVEPNEGMTSRSELVAGISPVVFAPPPVLLVIVDIEGEDVLTRLSGGLEPETDFTIGEDVGIHDKFGDFVIVDGTRAGTVITAVGFFVGDGPRQVAIIEPVEETEIAAFESLYGAAYGQEMVQRGGVGSRLECEVKVERSAADDVGIGVEDDVGNEAAVTFNRSNLYYGLFDLQTFVVASGCQIGARGKGMTRVFAMNVQDGTLAWVNEAILVAFGVFNFKIYKLQVGSQQLELTACGAFN